MPLMKRTSTGCVLLGVVLTLFYPAFLNARQPASRGSKRRTFTKPDGVFRFEYPGSFVSCKKDPNQSGWWIPGESCEAMIPVCSCVSCKSADTVSCVAYPAGRIKKGTNFQAATFSVNLLNKATTERECLSVAEPPPHVGTSRTETVNGAKLSVTELDGVGGGSLLDGYVYRGFHKKTCYELAIRIAYSNPGYADPGVMKPFDFEMVRRCLREVLNTFQFLK